MPRFSGKILSQDGDVIASDVEISISCFQHGALHGWYGSCDLSPTPQLNPNSVNQTVTFKI